MDFKEFSAFVDRHPDLTVFLAILAFIAAIYLVYMLGYCCYIMTGSKRRKGGVTEHHDCSEELQKSDVDFPPEL